MIISKDILLDKLEKPEHIKDKKSFQYEHFFLSKSI